MVTAPKIPSTVTNIYGAFVSCISLVEAPSLPEKISEMRNAFNGCTSLKAAPTIPGGAEILDMGAAFRGCTRMTAAPIIPANVQNLFETFKGCASLTGTLICNASIPETSSIGGSCNDTLNGTSITSIEGSCDEATKQALLKSNPSALTGVIPTGATYTHDGKDIVGNGTATFPDTPSTGDSYKEGDYLYGYNIAGLGFDEYGSSWCVTLTSSSQNDPKTSYGEIHCSIAGKPVTHMVATFAGQTKLTTAPKISASITNMDMAFYGCTALRYIFVGGNPTSYTNALLGSSVKSLDSYSSSVGFGKAILETKTSTNELIPENAGYGSELSGWHVVGDGTLPFPDKMTMGDVYMDPSGAYEFLYDYEGVYDLMKSLGSDVGEMIEGGFGSHWTLVQAINDEQSVYPDIPSEINGEPVTHIINAFNGNKSMTTAPRIPGTVISIYDAFKGCTGLTEAPVIPSSVQYMENAFSGCTALSGTLTCNANPKSYTDALKGTNITSVAGSCSEETKAALLATK